MEEAPFSFPSSSRNMIYRLLRCCIHRDGFQSLGRQPAQRICRRMLSCECQAVNMDTENGVCAPTPSARRFQISGYDHYGHRHWLEARLEIMVLENRTQFYRHATNDSEKACQDAEEARHRLCNWWICGADGTRRAQAK